MNHLGLFEGIGGFSLAARWAGWETPVMVECDPYCQAVLRKNFPDATIYGDIHEFDGRPYAGQIDIITGGFPCQPYSHAGKRAGNTDNRALWPQMLRVIREVRPQWVVGENVAGILSMDGGHVLSGILADLENEGYSVEIYSIPAIGIGAPHERERIWIIAHCNGWTGSIPIQPQGRRITTENIGANRQNIGVATDANLQRRTKQLPPAKPGFAGFCTGSVNQNDIKNTGFNCSWSEHWLPTATRLCRVDDGIPAGMDGTGNISTSTKNKKAAGKGHRIEALGNAIVPGIALQIFRAINEYLKTIT